MLTRTRFAVSAETIAAYQRDGFVQVPNIISRQEAQHFAAAAESASNRLKALSNEPMFRQLVNVWQQDETMKALTLHANVASAAEQLAGTALRLWHDQILIKPPHNNAPTEWHQDQPYWPHANSTHPISAWIALVDVPVERGCMTFIPGAQERTELPATSLKAARGLFDVAPDLIWSSRITVPLRAGDCTFHHGRTPHMATPNFTDDPRIAHVVIFVDAATTYTGTRHVVTDDLGLASGAALEGPLFPRVGAQA
jgi:ectoine hydroxylase-related dioxygenase (phytanoyl-CoA dioxygenase family)